jgi:hypothetical protein
MRLPTGIPHSHNMEEPKMVAPPAVAQFSDRYALVSEAHNPCSAGRMTSNAAAKAEYIPRGAFF